MDGGRGPDVREPIERISNLAGRPTDRQNVAIVKEPRVLATGLDTTLIELYFEPADVRLRVRGLDIVYDKAKQTLSAGKVVAPLAPAEEEIHLMMLVDRGSVELFGNHGAVALSLAHVAPEKETDLTVAGSGRLRRIAVVPTGSAWK